MGYAVYFVTNATAMFIRNLGHYWSRPISDVHMVVYFACLMFWLFALSQRRGNQERGGGPSMEPSRRTDDCWRNWKQSMPVFCVLEENSTLLMYRPINRNK